MALSPLKYAAVAALATISISSAAIHAQDNNAQPASHKVTESKAYVLSRAEVDALLAQPSKVVVVDVRRPDELTSIGGFPVYLSIQLSDLDKQLAWIPKDRQVVTVSNHAGRARKAADLLASKGFKVAGAIGAQNYEQEGGTLTKIAPKAPAAQANATSPAQTATAAQ